MFDLQPARDADAAELSELARHIFVETFSRDTAPADMAAYVAQTFGTERQRAEILDPKRRIILARHESRLAGFSYLFEGEVESCVQGPRPIELAKLYVASEWHGRGLGAILMERCLADARAAGFATIWLGVWERNLRALAFYRKYGFQQSGTHVFPVGSDPQIDLILEREL